MTAEIVPTSPFDAPRPRLFTIEAGRPFLKDLADALVGALGADISQAEILLPTRRAASAASEAFLDAFARNGRRAGLLPRLHAIGDVDEDEIAIFAGDAIDELSEPPAISSTERLVILARFVAARESAAPGEENWPAAFAAARELSRLLDSFYAEEIELQSLAALKIDDIAGHWAQSLRFLEIVTAEWPRYLIASGCSDPAQRRARLISAKARRLAEAPPSHPIVIAGTTASAPAVARLVEAIAQCPRGAVILPGLDKWMDARAFNAIDDAHPQAGLKALLSRLARSPDDVALWPGAAPSRARSNLLKLALRPAEATDDWLSLVAKMTASDERLADAADGLRIVEAESEDAEATIIAAVFRETIETPSETAMLVTPDRDLARRVALKMQRWGVAAEDSGGVPLSQAPIGAFLRLVALHLSDPDDPAALIALLRHPHAWLGLSGAERATAVDAIDRALRGVRRPDALRVVEQNFAARGATPPAPVAAALAQLRSVRDIAGQSDDQSFQSRLDCHLRAAELIGGAARLWAGEDGELAAELLSEMSEATLALDRLAWSHYLETLTALLAGATLRQREDVHPRLIILGPLEARLQRADRIILGGLNEGVWPTDAVGDPFLSRGMREMLGMPSPERKIGLSAHDFSQLASAPNVTLTRARRSGGGAAKPSRWLLRLRNILVGAKAIDAVDRSEEWRDIARALDKPSHVQPAERTSARAGVARRPRRLPVTQIEKWLRDPYGVYARYILNLRRLDRPGEPFGPRQLGDLFHAAFAEAALSPKSLAVSELGRRFDRLAAESGLSGSDRMFWSADIDAGLAWFAEFDEAQRRLGAPAIIEENGEMLLEGVSPSFALTAKADRIDLLSTGKAALFDYKTRRIPTTKQQKAFALQLPLTAAVIEAGGFQKLGKTEVARFDYLRIVSRKGADDDDSYGQAGAEARQAMTDAIAGLTRLIADYDKDGACFLSQPRPELVDDFGDYDQLARRSEWESPASASDS